MEDNRYLFGVDSENRSRVSKRNKKSKFSKLLLGALSVAILGSGAYYGVDKLENRENPIEIANLEKRINSTVQSVDKKYIVGSERENRIKKKFLGYSKKIDNIDTFEIFYNGKLEESFREPEVDYRNSFDLSSRVSRKFNNDFLNKNLSYKIIGNDKDLGKLEFKNNEWVFPKSFNQIKDGKSDINKIYLIKSANNNSISDIECKIEPTKYKKPAEFIDCNFIDNYGKEHEFSLAKRLPITGKVFGYIEDKNELDMTFSYEKLPEKVKNYLKENYKDFSQK